MVQTVTVAMNNSKYHQLEAAFLPCAQERMENLRRVLLCEHGVETSELTRIDRDYGKGYGFQALNEELPAVEFILLDGQGRRCNVSMVLGDVWNIYLPSSENAIDCPEDVVKRVEGLSIGIAAQTVSTGWTLVRRSRMVEHE